VRSCIIAITDTVVKAKLHYTNCSPRQKSATCLGLVAGKSATSPYSGICYEHNELVSGKFRGIKRTRHVKFVGASCNGEVYGEFATSLCNGICNGHDRHDKRTFGAITLRAPTLSSGSAVYCITKSFALSVANTSSPVGLPNYDVYYEVKLQQRHN